MNRSTRKSFNRKSKTTLFNASVLSQAVLAALLSSPIIVNAQEQDAKGGLEVIEVTARKTSESLQEVPLAVTSIGGQELAEKGISVLTEVQAFSPNTTLQTSRGTNSTLTAFIRGVGQQDPLWGYEPGVGIYIDDVYMARPQGAVLDLLDVERIEVLRGPQGTLYGKNTIGGAIKYVTKEMSGEARATAQATIGSYSQRDIKLTGQIPLVEDKLYVGFGFADLTRDGFGEYLISALPNQDLENYNKDLWAGRIDVEYSPTDDLFIRVGYDKTKDTSNAKGGYRLLPSLLTQAPVPDSVFDSYTSLPTFNEVELEGFSVMARYDYSENLELKYIGASREGYSPTNIDFDNTPLDIFDVPAEYKDENTSHEVQANFDNGRYSLVSGVYLYDGESCGNFDAILGFLGRVAFATPGLTREVTGCNNSESWAVYAQSSFNLSDQLSMTVGARYTDEEKTAFVNNGLVFANVYPSSAWVPGYVRPDGQLVPTVLGSDSDGDGVLDAPKSESWSRFTPRIGLEYQVNDDLMLFASYSQGFKSGTFNPRATINEDGVNPEIVDSFELGMKSDWNDSLRANVTLFSFDHKDRQYVGFGPGNTATDLQQVLRNVAESSAWGIESEFTYVATDNLSIDLALGYIDADVEAGNTIPPVIGLSNTPEMTINLSANYFLETDFGSFVFNGGVYRRDDYLLFETSDLLEQDAYNMVNVSVAWESMSGDWFASLHAKNLTDEEYLVGGYDFVTRGENGELLPGLGGDLTLIGYYGDPRTIHLTVGYRF